MSYYARRLLFYFTVAVFIIITPITIAGALGYGVDWQSKKIVLTGAIDARSIPKKADVFVDNKQKGKTPLFIKRVIPGYYQIKIEMEGYYPWQKNLKVNSKLVTGTSNVLLIPKQPNAKIVRNNLPADFSVEEFINLNETKKEPEAIYYLEESNNILYKTDTAGFNPEQISLQPLPENQTYNIFAVSDQRIALLGKETKQSELSNLYIFDSSARAFELITDNVRLIQFSEDNNQLLYITANELLIYHFEDKSEELITRSSQPIKEAIWYPKTNGHIIFTTNGCLKITELDSRDKRNTFNILEKEASQITYNPNNEKIYLIADNNLLSLTLE